MTSLFQYRRLLRYVHPHKSLFITSILATIVLAATQPATAALMKPLLDGSFVEKDPVMIVTTPLLMVALFLVIGISSLISSACMESTATHVVYDIRCEMFKRLLSLPSRYYDNNSTGVVLSKVTYDVEQLTQAATQVVIVLVRDTVTIIGLLGWAIYLSWELSSLVLTLIPVVILLVKLLSKRLRNINRALQQFMGEMTHVLEEVIRGNRVVKMFGGQQYEKERFRQTANKVRQYKVKNVLSSTANVQLIQVITVSCLALMAYLAAKMNFTVGEFTSFFAAFALILSPLKRLTGVNVSLQRGLAAADTVFALIDHASEPDTESTKPIQSRAKGELIFKNLTFAYSKEPIITEFSLHIRPGETVALVGPSGSGKTTLSSLIPRFYDAEFGTIFLDETDIRRLSLSHLRNNIALVSQDVILFNDTLRANIAYGGCESATDEEVINAARTANAIDFIEQMPEGFSTLIGDNGVRLSGGQRQRIAIARALLKNAPILILDEATSALDAESEQMIQDAMEKLRRGRTTIIIAHRLSTIEQADRIVVLDQGRIVQSGTHKELLQTGGLYKKLYDIQLTI